MDAMTTKELRQKAEDLGIDWKARWLKPDLINAIKQAETPDAPDETEDHADTVNHEPPVKPVEKEEPAKTRIKNISQQRWFAFNKVLIPGERYKPSRVEMSDDRDMKRVNRAVALGKLEWF